MISVLIEIHYFASVGTSHICLYATNSSELLSFVSFIGFIICALKLAFFPLTRKYYIIIFAYYRGKQNAHFIWFCNLQIKFSQVLCIYWASKSSHSFFASHITPPLYLFKFHKWNHTGSRYDFCLQSERSFDNRVVWCAANILLAMINRKAESDA